MLWNAKTSLVSTDFRQLQRRCLLTNITPRSCHSQQKETGTSRASLSLAYFGHLHSEGWIMYSRACCRPGKYLGRKRASRSLPWASAFDDGRRQGMGLVKPFSWTGSTALGMPVSLIRLSKTCPQGGSLLQCQHFRFTSRPYLGHCSSAYSCCCCTGSGVLCVCVLGSTAHIACFFRV